MRSTFSGANFLLFSIFFPTLFYLLEKGIIFFFLNGRHSCPLFPHLANKRLKIHFSFLDFFGGK